MLKIDEHITLPLDEIQWQAIRAQGAGGQNVNKVASAIHLRFDVHASSLPAPVKQRLLGLRDRRITSEGVVVIKAQQYRTQEANRDDALDRLRELILSVAKAPAIRRATRPTRASQRRRLDSKTKQARIKQARQKPDDWS